MKAKNIQAKKAFIKNTTSDAIKILLEEANKNAEQHPTRTKRYIQMLWRFVKKYKIRLSKDQKKKFCRKCLTFFVIDKTVMVIFNSKNNKIYLKCKSCAYKVQI